MAPPHRPRHNPRQEFDREARHYDRDASATMPRYAELHRMLAWGVPHLPTRPLRVLELGSGTGTLTALLLKTFPHARLLGLDLSPAMVTLARRKLNHWKDRVELRVGELDEIPQGEPFDVIVSCLAIHHLPDTRKQRLFARVFGALNPGGYFGDGDDHLPEDSRFDERFSALASGLSPRSSLARAPGGLQKVWHEHELFDHPVPLSREIQWLREAGFVHLDTPWRFFNQAVVWAYR
ncbi:methyltransferase type 12 [mine drainage metagenome]|uniref:Methyltransferase type 12 n=1 Tax=mine drainage metagenome TaxID=410659 RepID=T1CW42_9ZZZZ